MRNDLLRILKSLAYKRREHSLIDLGKHDLAYEKAMDKVVELGKQKEALELAPEAEETIDELLEAFDIAEMEQVNLAYLAGMAYRERSFLRFSTRSRATWRRWSSRRQALPERSLRRFSGL